MAIRKSSKINKDLLVYKVFYFFYFGALGTINPYLPVYLRQIGLSAFAVGLLVGVRPIIQLASAPFWTVLADKFRERKSILIMSIIAWLVMTIALVFVEPTEETCKLTARNRSHSLYTNYTTLKTGFFRRSNARLWGVENQITIKSAGIARRNAAKNKNTFSNGLKTKAVSSLLPSLSLEAHVLKLKTRDKLKDGEIQREMRGFDASKSTRQAKNNSDGLQQVLKVESQQRNTTSNTTNNDLFNILIRKAITNQQVMIHNLRRKNTVYPKVNHQTTTKAKATTQKAFKEAFDPYNMNGKSSPASPQLVDFFSKFHGNTTTNKPQNDIKYYNMNGVDTQTQNSRPNKVKFKEITPKLHRHKSTALPFRQPKRLKSINNDRMQEKETRIKKVNETLIITQRNLFKTNTNEMKRLFVILLVLIVVGEFLETPSAPLSDASLLEYLGESRIHYGKQRLWGSLGHGISSFLVGTLLERSRHLTCGEEFIDYSICFCAFTLLMLCNLVTTANFKFKYKDLQEKSNSILATVLSIHYISFLTAACYMGMCHGFLHNFIMWFLEDLGASKTLMGLAIGSRCFADLITFFVASLLIENLGQIKIVFIALVSYGTIFVAYSTMTNPWFALAVEFLEGFTYAASWSACTSYLAEVAPGESVATMQGVLQAVYWGLGTGSGAILGGHFIHTLGANVTFRLAATGSFVVALLFAVTQWKWQREDPDESLGIYEYFSTGSQKDNESLLNGDTDSNHKRKAKGGNK